MPVALQEYLDCFGCPVLPMSYESAELAKISINLVLAASIGIANALAELCESIGADWSEIAPALKLDRRIGPHAYLAPGLGIGGGNFERDMVSALAMAHDHGSDLGIVQAIHRNSDYRKHWVLRQLHRQLPAVSGARLAVWGLAYKVDTKSTRNSPAVALIEALPGTRMQAWDPAVETGEIPTGVVRYDSPIEASAGVDALAVMTPWDALREVDLARVAEAMEGDLVLDPYGVLDADRCAAHGLRHRRLGHTPTEGEV